MRRETPRFSATFVSYLFHFVSEVAVSELQAHYIPAGFGSDESSSDCWWFAASQIAQSCSNVFSLLLMIFEQQCADTTDTYLDAVTALYCRIILLPDTANIIHCKIKKWKVIFHVGLSGYSKPTVFKERKRNGWARLHSKFEFIAFQYLSASWVKVIEHILETALYQ